MKILELATTPHEAAIAQAVQVLRDGGLLIFPTETTYGAGVDATNQAAVEKLLAYKSRREGKPLSIAVSTQEMAAEYVQLTEQARALYAQFLPGPVTVVSKSLGRVAEGVASEFGTLGVRIPDYPLITEIVRALGKPITATSANTSHQKRPYHPQDIFDASSDKQLQLIDLVLDAGTLPPNPPSTVIDTTLSTPITLREGSLALTQSAAPHQHGYRSGTLTQLNSTSEHETHELAGRLLLKHWNAIQDTGLLIGLNGSLGVGKTVFTKGVAAFLRVPETITSPTYSYIEEYEFSRHGTVGKLFHLDLWKIESSAELERLELPSLLRPNNVVVVEWFSHQAAELTQMAASAGVRFITAEFEEKAPAESRPGTHSERVVRVFESSP